MCRKLSAPGIELGETGDAAVVAGVACHDRQAMFECECGGKNVVRSCPDRKISVQEVVTVFKKACSSRSVATEFALR